MIPLMVWGGYKEATPTYTVDGTHGVGLLDTACITETPRYSDTLALTYALLVLCFSSAKRTGPLAAR